MMILLTGSNSFAARQALDKLVALAISGHGQHSIDRVDGETLDPGRLPELLQGVSLFASERLVIMQNPAKNKPLWEALGDWAEKMPDGVTLVIMEQNLDKRTRTFKQIKKYGKVHEFAELSEQELAKWAVSVAKSEGASLDARAAAYLVRQVGTDQWRLWSELSKLMAANPRVTTELIDQLVEPSPQANVFDMLDMVLRGNTSGTMGLLAKLKSSEDPYKLFGLLVSQLHSLALVVAAKGKSADIIAKEAGVHPFVVRKLQPLARSINYEQLRAILAAMALTDTQLKSTGIDPWVLLEQCLGKIASRVS